MAAGFFLLLFWLGFSRFNLKRDVPFLAVPDVNYSYWVRWGGARGPKKRWGKHYSRYKQTSKIDRKEDDAQEQSRYLGEFDDWGTTLV